MSAQTFTAPLEASTVGNGGHWVRVPQPVMAAVTGKGRARVKATFNGVAYRGSIVKYAGDYVLGVTRAIMQQADLSAGDTVEVSVELDTEERTVAVPRDLDEALRADPGLKAAWDALSYTHRKEKARSLEEARKPETRARRLAKLLRDLPG